METEFKVGDRVKSGDKNIYEGNIVALCGDYAWVKYDSPTTWPDPMTESLTALTRIEPAVPQPKFRVGQRVRLREIVSAEPYEIVGLEIFYDLGWRGWWRGDKLEAVPARSPTCGKVG